MNRVLIITGASRGIGAEIAVQAARAGFDICINYASSGERAEQVAQQVRAEGVRAMTFQADMGAEAEIVALFKAVDETLGTVYGLVNNAGITGKFCRVDELDIETAQRVIDVNVVGCLITAREAVRRMSTKHGGKGGVIINISSIASKLGSPGEYVHYAASKGAIDVLTIGLAKEVAKENIRVNAIMPGIVDTEIHANSGRPNRIAERAHLLPMGRGGQPEEIANAVMWLLDDNNTFTSGACIPVAGAV
ncbi:MAG: SDR family oxidoreductase [Rhodospirillales bacterium]|nr:SDR family oxidoreductase [Rhodospirillales bacterium]